MSEKECEFYKPNLCGIPYSCKSPSWYNCKIIEIGRKLFFNKLNWQPTKELSLTEKLQSIFRKKKTKCYHQWSYFNKWCQACCEFGHGVIVSHCFKCGKYWDKEFGFWSQEEINNQFFNEFFHDNFPKNKKKKSTEYR